MALLLPGYPRRFIGTSAEPYGARTAPHHQRSVVRRSRINKVARKSVERNVSIAGAGAYVPVIYGKARTGPLVAQAVTYQNDLVMCLVWCVGEIEAIDGLYMQDGTAAPASVTATHYTGTTTQGVDPTLAAAISGWTKTLVETIQGETVALAYSVVRIAQSKDMNVPQFVAEIRGMKVYDPREVSHSEGDPSTWEYSENPALALANLEASSIYGRGQSVDWDTVEDVADDCDEVVAATEARRKIGLAIDNRQTVDAWIETMSVYAACYVNCDGATTRFASNRPGSSVASITHDHIMSTSDGAPDLSISIRSSRDVPTVVRIIYTDTSASEWRDGSAYAYASGVLAGTTEWRESVVSLPGITRYTQAYREAVERLNMLALTDLDVSWVTTTEGLKYQVGDIVTVTSDRGLTAKPIRITDIDPSEAGRWRVSGHEYQSAVYSDAIESEPTYTDTDLPSPLDPPDPTGLTLTEEVYQGANGIWASRISVTWDASTYVYLNTWEVQIFEGSDQIAQGMTAVNEYASPAVNDQTTYTVKVRSISNVGATSDWVTDTIEAAGKYLVPGDVPTVNAYEAGGTSRIRWTAAVDVDIWRYEVRYVATGGDWSAGIVVDRVDGLTVASSDIPPGDWDAMVKAIDSVGQYSTTEARTSFTVDEDSGAYVVDDYDFTSATTTNMHNYQLTRTDTLQRYVTGAGEAADTVFTGDLTAYTNPAATYHGDVTSEFLTETFDIGSIVTGTWTAYADRMELLGNEIETYLELSSNGSTWDQYEFLTTKAAARYARIRVKGLTSDTVYCTIPQFNVYLNVIPRVETGSDTSSATGAVRISTAGEYAAAQMINIAPQGTSPRSWSVDDITIETDHVEFDVYIFDSDGNLTATDFQWEFRGV